MAKLAIKGHPTRGEEVIEILAMLGGSNAFGHIGNNKHAIYYINETYKNFITCSGIKKVCDCTIFTLEEFLEKFPYKVGDKILYKTYGIYAKIKTMLWNEEKEQVFYHLKSNKLFVATADELKTNKEEIMENKPDLLQQLKDYFDNTPREVIEKEWHEYDKYNEIGPSVEEYLEYVKSIKQPQYPKNYEECCEVIGYESDRQSVTGYLADLIEKFQQLLICRDAYWKIGGEPDIQNNECYCLYYSITDEAILKQEGYLDANAVLTFPTKEMRDAFYENFKELINECKEFL